MTEWVEDLSTPSGFRWTGDDPPPSYSEYAGSVLVELMPPETQHAHGDWDGRR